MPEHGEAGRRNGTTRHGRAARRVLSARSGQVTIQAGEGIQSGGLDSGDEHVTVPAAMPVTTDTTTAAGRIFFDKLAARLGREPTVEDLVGAVAQQMEAKRHKLRVRKTIAVRIREGRHARELTQADLALRLDVSDKHVNRWEHAHRPAGRTPSLHTRNALARALDIPVARLYPESEPIEDLVELTPAEEQDLL